MYSSYSAAAHVADGVVYGTLWRQQESGPSHAPSASTAAAAAAAPAPATSPTSSAAPASSPPTTSSTPATTDRSIFTDFCVLTGIRLRCYESVAAYQRGDVCTHLIHIVGASAHRQLHQQQSGGGGASTTGGFMALVSASSAAADTSFRLVSDRGAHYYCQAPSAKCRDVWLSTLCANLEQSLLEGDDDDDVDEDDSNLTATNVTGTGDDDAKEDTKKQTSATTAERKGKAKASSRTAGRTIYPTPEPKVSIKRPSVALVLRGSKPPRYCTSCGAVESTHKPLLVGSALWQYGREAKSDVCNDCYVAQGLLDHLEDCADLLRSASHDRKAVRQALILVRGAIQIDDPPIDNDNEPNNDNDPDLVVPAAGESHPNDDHDSSGTSESWTHIASDRSASTPSPPDPSSMTSPAASSATGSSSPPDNNKMGSSWQSLGDVSGPGGSGSGSSLLPSLMTRRWVQVPPSEESTRALLAELQSPAFSALARTCPLLDRLREQVVAGYLDVPDFVEQLEHLGGERESRQSLLKQQAFRVAGDMGSAVKLLADYALKPSTSTSTTTGGGHDEPQLLRCILDFFLDLVENRGDLASIAFFWPQLCHLHLRMLPPRNGIDLARVELMEDFLVTIAARHSIHLALELVWSHTADLEESLSSGAGGTTGSTSTGAPCSAACRRRRFAVLRFVCELESVLFDFEGAWGGGSVSLGKMLQPTGHQVELLKSTMKRIQALRRRGKSRLSRSFLMESLSVSKFDRPADLAVKEKLRIAKNADYFSSHLNFTRRLCDTAEKLRFMEVDRRAQALSEELELLNSSGAMGGDPLNLLRDDELVRVVRIPSTEGHVFRSKERTPVLLLVEVVNDGVDVELAREPKNALVTGDVDQSEDLPDFASKAQEELLKPDDATGEEATGEAPVTGVEILPAGERVQPDEPSQTTSPRPASPLSRSTSTGTTELEGSLHEKASPRLSGLKRFEDSYDTPTTPKSDVERLVSTAMEHQQITKVPDLSTPDLLADDSEGGSDSEPLDTFQDAKQEQDDPQAPLVTIDELASLSGASQDEPEGPADQDAPESPPDAASTPLFDESIEPEAVDAAADDPEDDAAAPATADSEGATLVAPEPRQSCSTPVQLVATDDAASMSPTSAQEPHPAFTTPVKGRQDSAETPDVSASPSEPGKHEGNRPMKRGSKKKSTLGGLICSPGDVALEQELAPTGDVRREVLTAIMMRGIQGKDSIAAGAADSVQRSLKELERQRATELLLTGSLTKAGDPLDDSRRYSELESTRDKLVSLGIGSISPTASADDDARKPTTEEDEVMEAIRLLLIQNRVAQGQLSEADAALVLQHTSLSKRNSTAVASPTEASSTSASSSSRRRRSRSLDRSEMPTIDAGDVDPRLVGCGALPPAILQALTLWKAEMVNSAELLELVKKDLEFLRHSVLHEAENVEKLHEDSAFWGRFAFGERWAEKKSRIAASSPEGSVPGWDLVGVIVKSNDDLRQESFVMQLIELCQEAFEMAGLELWVNPYRILATGRTTGVIEMVRNAMSFDALKKRPGYGKGGLREHLHRMTEFTADPGDAFKSAQQNFVRSLAAYSLLSYLFQFKDRHNGNLLLDTAGHVIHIDFGFVFGVAPGGSFSLEMSTPFKLTEEMLDVMGGLKSPLFSEFVTLFCCGFLALQPHAGTFLTLVDITCRGSTFKCFEGRDPEDVVSKLRERFAPDLSKEETVSFALDLIRQAVSSYGTRQYDMFQYLSQGIAT